jgi:S1-C subfamily serine protease
MALYTNALRLLVVALFCSTVVAQISQKDACQKFASAVVRIETGRGSLGTGFLISSDGWILTAAHVVIDPTSGKADEAISIVFADGAIKLVTQTEPIEPNMAGRDYALLKIDGTDFPHLDLGDKPENMANGSDLTIIGFPFSAYAFHASGPSVKDKFCLSGTVAFTGFTDVSVPVKTPKGPSTVNVNVDVIYFQGPSVKGLSGSPIISRETGHVVGILTSKLSGITPALEDAGEKLHTLGKEGAQFYMGAVSVGDTFAGVIDTLDGQLANGLGAGTGIEDAKSAYKRILRQRHSSPK